jgi:hypothetical protein
VNFIGSRCDKSDDGGFGVTSCDHDVVLLSEFISGGVAGTVPFFSTTSDNNGTVRGRQWSGAGKTENVFLGEA